MQACGRVLAKDMIAGFDNPPFDRSPVDGYACKAEDITDASESHPVLPEADGTTKNVFPCKVERVIEDVFSYILIVSTKEEARIRVDVTKEQWQQYQKHISGNKIWIGIDEKDVMLLK